MAGQIALADPILFVPVPPVPELADPIPFVPVPPVPELADPTRQPLSKLSVLAAVAHKSGPHLIEATIIPAALFYFFLIVAGVWTALVAALCWSYSALARRLLFRRGVPPILILALVGLTARSIAAVTSGSSFVYFLQPIFGTVAVGGVFLASLFGRPLVGRLAADFCPLTPEVAARPAVLRLFRGLTILWAGVNLITAATTFVLLMSLPIAAFVAAKTLSGLAITITGIVLTVSWSLRTARHEGLLSGGPLGPALVLRM
jgi:hypothetical protein